MKFCRWRRLTWIVVLAVTALSSAIVVVILYGFNPPNAVELASTKANHKLIAVAIDSADGTVLVQACDWPYTFFSPFVLGDVSSNDGYESTECYWSKDGTLAVLEVQKANEKTKLYFAAYDFRKHVCIDAGAYAWNTQKCHEAIVALLIERGGAEPSAIDIPSLNSGLYQ